MQDGTGLALKLLSNRQINGVTYYHIQVQIHEQTYLWQQRYSVLKQTCRQFPNTTKKFPPKDSIRHKLNKVVNLDGLLSKRFNLMKQYFISLSSSSQLRFNIPFLKLCKNLQIGHQTIHQRKHYDKAPVIKGRKLSPIVHANAGQKYIVL